MKRRPVVYLALILSVFLPGFADCAGRVSGSVVPVVSLLLNGKTPQLVYPPEKLFHVHPIPTGKQSMPKFLIPVTGDVFANRITRITDVSARELAHTYPKTQSWNCDGTYLRMDNTLLDGRTYTALPEPLGNLNNPTDHIDDRRWSHSKPNIMYGLQRRWNTADTIDNGINDNHYDFVAHDVEKTENTVTRLVRFSGNTYATVKMGPGEGNVDYNDSIVAFAALKHGADYLTLIVFDMRSNTIVKVKDFHEIAWDGGYNEALDWVSVSAHGKYVLINWEDSPGQGDFSSSIYQYDSRTLTFIRKLANQGSHGDLGIAADNREVYVQFEYGSRAGIWMYYLDTGDEIQLLPSKYNGGHVSCRNYKRPGWCYLSTNQETYREVFAIKLDGSGLANRFAQTHIAEYNDEDEAARPAPNSQGGTSPDGTKILFESNWDNEAGSDGFQESFVVEVVQ
jgi:hypothetical protein